MSVATPFEPTEAQLAAVDKVAGFVSRFGLATPAIMAIESMRPLSFVGSQFMHVLTPSIGIFLPPEDWNQLALLLEDRRGLEVLLRRIEDIGENQRT